MGYFPWVISGHIFSTGFYFPALSVAQGFDLCPAPSPQRRQSCRTLDPPDTRPRRTRGPALALLSSAPGLSPSLALAAAALPRTVPPPPPAVPSFQPCFTPACAPVLGSEPSGGSTHSHPDWRFRLRTFARAALAPWKTQPRLPTANLCSTLKCHLLAMAVSDGPRLAPRDSGASCHGRVLLRPGASVPAVPLSLLVSATRLQTPQGQGQCAKTTSSDWRVHSSRLKGKGKRKPKGERGGCPADAHRGTAGRGGGLRGPGSECRSRDTPHRGTCRRRRPAAGSHVFTRRTDTVSRSGR